MSDDLMRLQSGYECAEGDGLDEGPETGAMKADMATVRLFLQQLAKDERWAERANAMLAVTKAWE